MINKYILAILVTMFTITSANANIQWKKSILGDQISGPVTLPKAKKKIYTKKRTKTVTIK